MRRQISYSGLLTVFFQVFIDPVRKQRCPILTQEDIFSERVDPSLLFKHLYSPGVELKPPLPKVGISVLTCLGMWNVLKRCLPIAKLANNLGMYQNRPVLQINVVPLESFQFSNSGYQKYMRLMEKGINLVFIDNQTICTDYIKQLLDVAEKQNLIAKISLENTVKLLLYVELDRVEQERLILQRRIKDGMEASDKKPGRKEGTMEKLTPQLEGAIFEYLNDRSIRQIDIMKNNDISRNTLKKYIRLLQEKTKS